MKSGIRKKGTVPFSLRYRAGTRAFERLHRDGLRPDVVRAFVGPASGPKWLALVGLDRALVDAGFLRPAVGGPHRLFAGASAGAWRALSFAAPDPHATHSRLVDGYVGARFAKGAGPGEISETYLRMLTSVFPPSDVSAICGSSSSTVAVHVARLRGPFPWSRRVMQIAGLGLAAALHVVTRWATDLLVDRVLITTRSDALGDAFRGTTTPLTPSNFHLAALASGSVPVYMSPVREIPGLARDHYVDGGISDYHLRERYVRRGDGITLLPHFQDYVGSVWFDGRFVSRLPAPETVADVLQIFPSQSFVESLPEQRLPDRDDFFRFASDPDQRIRRWRETVARSAELGEAFDRDFDSGSWIDRLEPMPHI